MAKPPTYLFSYYQFQRAQRQKPTEAPNLVWRASLHKSLLLFRFLDRVARLAPRWCISAPPVRGVLGLVAETRKCFFSEMCTFFDEAEKSHKI